MTAEERIARLEKENRKHHRFSCFLALGLVAALGMMGAATRNRTLEAEKILLKDSRGQVRISLGIGENGPALEFRNSDQKSEISLRTGDMGPILILSNKKSGKHATLGSTTHIWGLRLTDADGNTRAQVTASESGGHIIQQNTIIR